MRILPNTLCISAALLLLSGPTGAAPGNAEPPVAPATEKNAESNNATVPLNLPAQPMRDALTALGKQTGLQVVYTAQDVTERITAPGLEGRFTPHAALTRLLENSGLYFEFLNERTVAIRSA